MPASLSWPDALRLHEHAAAEFARAVEALDEQSWARPRADGKWSPAQITEHLVRAYQVLLDELGGGPGMQIRTRRWQRILLRLWLVPRLLAGRPFPRGARAPRETRPLESGADAAAAVAAFRDHAARFTAEMARAHRAGARRHLTHAYFGRSSLHDALVLCARHIQHHRGQIPAPNGAESTAQGNPDARRA